jgi:hypothetical protein
MFVGLCFKEIKYQMKSIIVYLYLIIVIVFYFTEFEPPNLNKPVAPMDKMHFFYWEMVQDYHDGKLYDKATYENYSLTAGMRELTGEEEKILKASNLTLTPKQKDVLRDAIKQMNPVWVDKWEDVTGIRFFLNNSQFEDLMQKVDNGLGGMTYYNSSESRRSNLLHDKNQYPNYTQITEPKARMEKIYTEMKIDLSMGQLYKYSLNFFGKFTRLNNQQKALIKKAMQTIEPVIKGNSGNEEILEAYRKLIGQMDEIDRLMGGGTLYGKLFREVNLTRPMNYQEAQADFKTSMEKEGLTNAYGRYFADYMGIAAGFLTVFISGFIFTRDRRYRMHELINSRTVSSLTYVAAKFLAVTVVAFVCILVPATHATAIFARISQMYSYQIDYLAFYKYAFIWILPTIMFSNAFGMLLSVIFDNGIIPVLAQVSFWSTSLNNIIVDYSLLRPVIRFNTVGDYNIYQKYLEAIITNRVFYVAFSLSVVFLTSLIWERRRCSSYEGIKLLKHIKIQYKNYIQY